MSKGPRADVIALAALASAAAAGIALLILRSGGGGRADPLAAVPADSFMVVSIDVASLAQSPLGEALVGELKGEGGERAATLLGVDSITTTCGFDPLPHLRSIAVAVPEGGERGDFGVAASGTLGKEALANCAKAVIAKRGGEATTREAGSFTVVSDARTPGGAEVAFREGGPYLVGRGAWLGRMIDAADGRVPSTLVSSGGSLVSSGGSPSAPGNTHAQLRADLATRDTDAEAIRATALLPRPLRERLQLEMAHETAAAAQGTSEPGDGANRANDAMQGVLAVSAAALGLHAGRAHEDTRLVAELRCDTESACKAVSTLILHTRLRLSGNLGYRLFGLGPLLDNPEVQQEAAPAGPAAPGTHASLYVRTRAPTDDLAKMLDRALHAATGAPPPKKVAPHSPDEALAGGAPGTAPKDAGAR
jgi:hypothetical protein